MKRLSPPSRKKHKSFYWRWVGDDKDLVHGRLWSWGSQLLRGPWVGVRTPWLPCCQTRHARSSGPEKRWVFSFLLHKHRRCFWIVSLVLPCPESFVGELGCWDWVEPLLITLPLDNRHPAYTFRHWMLWTRGRADGIKPWENWGARVSSKSGRCHSMPSGANKDLELPDPRVRDFTILHGIP